MDIVSLLISLVSGAVGGNGAGAILKQFSLGPLWNSIVGILGGGLGAFILNALGLGTGAEAGAAAAGSLGANIIGNLVAGLVGGGVLLPIIGFVRKLLSAA